MSRVEELYKIIKESQDELEIIRKNCEHKDTHQGQYSSGPGRIQDGYICDYCGYFLGKMYTAEVWIENPNTRFMPYDNIKEYLLQGEYSNDLLSWDQFVKLTGYYELTDDKISKWKKSKIREERINKIIDEN